MPAASDVNHVVRQWVLKAENDLLNAQHTLGLKRKCPTDTVCWHAQQCVEKYLKSFLVYKSIDFPRTHSIVELMALIPSKMKEPTLTREEQVRLTAYSTATRYPGDYREISLSEARRAVKVARRVRAAIRKLLPKEVTEHA